MKYTLLVNQQKALELGISNINQAHILDLLMSCSTWAEVVLVDGEVYYWVARQRICEELPILGIKPDTAYRHLKKLADLGLIEYRKSGKRDCIRVTEKGKSYYVGNESEKAENAMSEIDPKTMSEAFPKTGNSPMSEMNPKKLGNKSDISYNHTYPEKEEKAAAAPPASTSSRPEEIQITESWKPDIARDTLGLLTTRGLTDELLEEERQRFITHHLAPAPEAREQRTRSAWTTAFVRTLNRAIARIQSDEANQRNHEPGPGGSRIRRIEPHPFPESFNESGSGSHEGAP